MLYDNDINDLYTRVCEEWGLPDCLILNTTTNEQRGVLDTLQQLQISAKIAFKSADIAMQFLPSMALRKSGVILFVGPSNHASPLPELARTLSMIAGCSGVQVHALMVTPNPVGKQHCAVPLITKNVPFLQVGAFVELLAAEHLPHGAHHEQRTAA